jgi:PAS domain S-box-containing protein
MPKTLILVVGANDAQRSASARILRRTGSEVVEELTLEAALRAAEQNPDLVVSVLPAEPVASGLSLARDETELYRAMLREQQARTKAEAAEERIAAILESITDAFFAVDREWRFTYVNETAERLLQRQRSALLGQPIWEMFPVAETFRWQAENALKAQRAIHFNYCPAPGTWFEVHAYPLSTGLSVYFSDVTEQKQAEEALRLSETRLRVALEAANAGMWEWDPATNQHLWSEGLWRLYGLEPHSCAPCQDTWLAAVHPEDRRLAGQRVSDAAKEGVECYLEYRILEPDGTVRWLMSCGRPVRAAGDQPVRFIGIVMDITERKLADVTLRTAEKFAATGRLAATLAHEINNPLAAVMNLLFLLEENPTLDTEARSYLEMGQQELMRIAHITRQMLGFYRETQKPVPLKPAEVLESVLGLYARKFSDSQVQVQTEYGFQGEVESFPSELRQVISNLLSNALDAMESKGGSIRIRVSPAREWKGRWSRRGVRITIGDTGPGIPSELRKRVFDAFFTTKGERGTGLGLWVSQGIIEKLGGVLRMRTSTRPNASGTCFSIFLPARTQARVAA